MFLLDTDIQQQSHETVSVDCGCLIRLAFHDRVDRRVAK